MLVFVGLTSQLSLILHMNLDPFLLDFGRVHGVLGVMPDHLQLGYVEVHHVFERASFALVKRAVEF
jgi:hypothetical protein